MVLLDTNLCLLIIEKAPSKALERLLACSPDEVAISAITLGELAHGVARSETQEKREKQQKALELLLAALSVVEFSAEAALRWAELRTRLEEKGGVLGALETMIAAHALSLGATLATSSPKNLRRVPELSVENWAR